MSLGTTLTVTLDGSGGTAKVLPLINGPYEGQSEYFLDETTVWWRAKVRHSSDNVKAGTQAFDRHTVTFQRYLKPSGATPGRLTEIIYTVRNDPNEIAADIIDLSEAMSFYMVKAGGIAAKLLGKEA
ncbi:coat protein [ssRNA phage Zoerhiza.4_12]|uniref:Coat protein n=2 Tax=Leviviricetes TaxID=2842243 RepID=A0A8S5L1V8_9VIRU|nr:coat protein [ssRNA phage Zoerhiza.4_12]QDH88356.1 MAG: hypothetical protein H4Rhizo43540_000002 [Leviviridae sp.]QDH90448.1 MAG: hypothetical protein H2Bulk3641_000004 [Leviviridae sp.]DAD51584.1 TPA_asm: coat protein [ssRNA phage Zoerhiza.4_12]